MENNINELKHISLPKKPDIKNEESYIRPLQSANVLFKFMNRLEFLKTALLKGAIIPRYYEEKIDYLNITAINKIAFPMICFCDIHLNRLGYHIGNYGQYGIGLSKKWGIEQGIQPIHYINPISNLRKDFSGLFNTAYNEVIDVSEKMSKYNNYLLHDLFYMKPISGEMLDKDGHLDKRNFHDEKEWRYIPDFSEANTDLPLVISQEFMNPKSYDTYSQGIIQCSELWLRFEPENIKHIIVNVAQERSELINFIIKKEIGSKEQQYILFSKKLVFEELEEDW